VRELVYFVAPSLDGRIASPTGDVAAFPSSGDHIDWIAREYPDTLPKVVLDALGISADGSRFDTALMGWRTYAAGLAVGVDDPYPHLRQIVFSRSAREMPAGIEPVREDPVGRVRALKKERGTPIWLCGGGGLAGALLGEIDRLVLKVNPVLLGAGVPMIDAPYDPGDFALVSSTTYESGVVVSEYVRR
jgi:dihydrofolate reductase